MVCKYLLFRGNVRIMLRKFCISKNRKKSFLRLWTFQICITKYATRVVPLALFPTNNSWMFYSRSTNMKSRRTKNRYRLTVGIDNATNFDSQVLVHNFLTQQLIILLYCTFCRLFLCKPQVRHISDRISRVKRNDCRDGLMEWFALVPCIQHNFSIN